MTAFPSYTGAASACAASVIGVEGHLTHAGAMACDGPLGMRITGLPETVVRETRDRVYAAVANSGQPWPARAITVTLRPASLPRHGTGFDLAIAIAVLTAASVVPAAALHSCVFTAELGLDGSLRPVRGVLPALLAARSAGYTRAVVAVENAAEAVMVAGLAVVPCADLRTVLAWLRGESFPHQPDISAAGTLAAGAGVPVAIGVAGLAVSLCVRQAIEATAAGGHHLCLTGPHGARIPALAAGLAALMPPLEPEQMMEVTVIHSAAGLLGSGHALVTRPPFRAPHRTATRAAILGGGTGMVRPGEAALAHRGVLFLRDAPEFPRDILTSLRQPLQYGEVTVTRAGRAVRFPAKFTLIAGTAPCPCGGRAGCSCSALQARRYRARLAGELGSYIAIFLDIAPPGPGTPGAEPARGDADAVSAARVADARYRARRRLRDTPWQANGDIPAAQLRRSWPPTAEALAPVSRAVDLGEISARAAHDVVRVAWTLADLAGAARPGPDECGQALAFQLGVAQ
jgi:magnesium chelatase family protein